MVAEVFIKLKLILTIIIPTYLLISSLGYSLTVFILILGVYAIAFAGYSAGRVSKMAYNFNPCEQARIELEDEIVEARKHLNTIGL